MLSSVPIFYDADVPSMLMSHEDDEEILLIKIITSNLITDEENSLKKRNAVPITRKLIFYQRACEIKWFPYIFSRDDKRYIVTFK